MRLVWLAALSVLAVAMAVFTPYAFRHESIAETVGWCVMLVSAFAAVGALIRAELLIRKLDRRTVSDVTEPDGHQTR
jgi:hypothetical protein